MKNLESTMEQLVTFIESRLTTKGILGGKIRYEREVTFPKGRGKNRTEMYNRFFDEVNQRWRVTEVYTRQNIRFGLSYARCCEYNMPKQVLEEVKAYPVEVSYAHPYMGDNLIYQNNKDENRFYLRAFETTNSNSVDHIYLIDGIPATDEQVKYINEHRNWDKKQTEPCPKQQSMGIEKVIALRTFLLEGIKFVEVKSDRMYL